METFDLSTAASFLPIMDDTENVTKQLISSIKMYDSLLDEKSKPVLLNFILTTRLSNIAKLRLTKQYNTVEQLVGDMNQHLLTKKSFTALQQQLLGCTQNQKTIDDYGKEIEDLFVELTIAQADGDNKKRKVLQPLNEKTAINQFANGLKNSKLSAIIAARTYASLKDAIRDAKDEEAVIHARSNYKSDNKQFVNTFTPPRGPAIGTYNLGSASRGTHGYQNQRGPGAPSHQSQVNRGGYNNPSHHGHGQANRGGYHKPSYHGDGLPSHGGHNQPSRGGHSQSSCSGHSQSSRGGLSQSSRGGHNQSSRGGHNQSNRGGHNQSNRGGHSQPGRSEHCQSNRGGHSQPSRGNFQSGHHHAGRNNDIAPLKIETKVVVTTTTISNAKPLPKNNNPPNNNGPKTSNPSKNNDYKNNTLKNNDKKNNDSNKNNVKNNYSNKPNNQKNNPSKTSGPKK